MPRLLNGLALALLALVPCVARGQAISGIVFNDYDRDGVQDAGEPGIDNVTVRVFSASDDLVTQTADGFFSADAIAGCNLVEVVSPGPQWRRSLPDQTPCPSGVEPGLRHRYGAPENLRANLADPAFRYISLGDSIAAGVSICFFDDTNYVEDVAVDLGCIAGRTVSEDNRAVAGWHSEDLLTPMNGSSPNPQFVANVVAADPRLVTISIGGNDFLNTEPGGAGQSYPYDPAELQASFQELVNTRRTVQEILSVLTWELPLADLEINTVYDNLADTCATTDFHAAGTSMWNQMLRNLAWGQVRPALLAEIQWDMAHQDVTRTSCCGQEDRICAFDGIHPNHEGSLILEQAVLESLGGVTLPPGGTRDDFAIGYQELVAVLAPTRATVLAGTVTNPDAALTPDGNAALVAPGGELELSGFRLPPGLEVSAVIAGVRYKTSAAFTNDKHWFDASFVHFAPPQWNFTGWDTVTPLAGGSGTRGNLDVLSRVNATLDVPSWRQVSGTVTLNAIDDGRSTGSFTWPSPAAADVAELAIRARVDAVGTPDAANVEWESAYALVFGRRLSPPPGEISGRGAPVPLTVTKEGGGFRLDWQADANASDYRIYRGVIGAWASGVANPGTPRGGCSSTTTFLEPGVADSNENWFWLVSGVSSAGAEGPVGYANDDPAEAPRSVLGAICP